MNVKRLLVCGSRNWEDFGLVERWIARIEPEVVIEGGAMGADRAARNAARKLGVKVETFPAKWSLFGPAAGPKRNQQMLDVGKPTMVLAFQFPPTLDQSRGTADMVRRARLAGLRTVVVDRQGNATILGRSGHTTVEGKGRG